MLIILELITGLLTIVIFVLTNPAARNRAGGRNTSNTTSHVPRPLGHAYRRSLIQPAQPHGRFTAEDLANSIQCSGRIPLERHRHKRNLIDSWRALTIDFLCVKTTPKPAFAISSWEIHPKPTIGSDTGCICSAGFVLSGTLHKGESRYHLRRSLRSGKARIRSKRLVVIAAADDLANLTAQVRCLVVDSSSMSLPEGGSRRFAISNADPLECNGPTCYSEQRGNVSPDAIWLILMTPHLPQPSSSWGEDDELWEAHPVPGAKDLLQENDCGHAQEYVANEVKEIRTARIVAAVYAGVLTALYLCGLWQLSRIIELSESVFREMTVFGAVFLTMYSVILILYIGYFAKESVRSLWWRCHDDVPVDEWKAGTLACLVMGSLLRKGPLLRKDGWKRFWEDEDLSGGDPSKQDGLDTNTSDPTDGFIDPARRGDTGRSPRS